MKSRLASFDKDDQRFPLTELLENPHVRRDEKPNLPEYVTIGAARDMRSLLKECPVYDPTPLHGLDPLSAALDLGAVYYKDEAPRLGLKSFKALGGPYAVGRVIQNILQTKLGGEVTLAELASPDRPAECGDITVTSATDGNHGRAVAAGARLFGANCVIFLPRGASPGREAAIADLGAQIVRVDGNYDQAVREADRTAASKGWHVVSDTSYAGYEEIPKDVMRGYGVIMAEVFDQMDIAEVSHLFLQGGVGAFAAVMSGIVTDFRGPDRPRIIVVEPEKAACLTETARAGRPVVLSGDHDTMMACLACGEVSGLAWDILSLTTDAFLTVPDTGVAPTMRMLASGEFGARIEAGESAVAGLLGLLAACQDGPARAALGLDETSVVLVIGTEGATDPDIYRQVIEAG